VEDQGGRKCWIPDGPTVDANGGWGAVQVIFPPDQIDNPIGPMINSVVQWYKWDDGSLIQGLGDPAVYVMEGGQRRWVPDPPTLEHHWRWDDVQVISSVELNAIVRGADWPKWPPEQQQPAPAPVEPLLRFDTGDQHLGANHWMRTTGRLVRASGEIAGTTRTWTRTWFGGFHGAVSVILTDENDDYVPHPRVLQRYGVDGTWIGQSDRTEPWAVYIDANNAQRVRQARVFHTWAPDEFSTILDKWVEASEKGARLAENVGKIAAVVAAFGA
jgi:hypothetical protein